MVKQDTPQVTPVHRVDRGKILKEELKRGLIEEHAAVPFAIGVDHGNDFDLLIVFINKLAEHLVEGGLLLGRLSSDDIFGDLLRLNMHISEGQ